MIYGIKIYSFDDCGINYISNKTNQTIKKDDILNKDESIIFDFINEEYEIKNCTILYNSIITEPDYEEYNKYPNYILNKDDENEKNNFENILYEGKLGYFNIIFNQSITKNCGEENINCDLCLKNNNSICFSCKHEYNYSDGNKICIDNEIDSTIIENNLSETNNNEFIDDESKSENIINIGNCSIEDIVNKKCPNILLTNEQLKQLYWYIKNNMINKDYNQENIIIQTEEVFFQLSTLEDQLDSNFYLSSIDLRDCENTLRQIYQIDDEKPLIIFKIDIKNKNLSVTYVKYEIYDSESYNQLNLTYCYNTDIIMNVPVDLDSETISLYDSLNEYGYNLFDSNDSFYNDICTVYNSENDKDIILNDRKNIIYKKNGNKSLCQDDCTLRGYNSTNKKAICQCSAQIDSEEPDLDEKKMIFNTNVIREGFFKTIKNSNFLVLKCYKLVFDLKNLIKNIGMIIMSIIILISIILIIFHCFKEQNKIREFIESIIKLKFFLKNIKKRKRFYKSKTMHINKESGKSINKKRKKRLKKRTSISIYNITNCINNININNLNDLSRKESKKLDNISNKSSKLTLLDNKENIIPKIKKIYIPKVKKNTLKSNKIKKRKRFPPKNNYYFFNHKWLEELKTLKKKDIVKMNQLNDKELNSLEYEIAVIKDKRTYIQYYWS